MYVAMTFIAFHTGQYEQKLSCDTEPCKSEKCGRLIMQCGSQQVGTLVHTQLSQTCLCKSYLWLVRVAAYIYHASVKQTHLKQFSRLYRLCICICHLLDSIFIPNAPPRRCGLSVLLGTGVKSSSVYLKSVATRLFVQCYSGWQRRMFRTTAP